MGREPTMSHRRAPRGGKQTGKQRAEEGAGFGGDAGIDDFKTQRIGDRADGGRDEAHALRRVEHHGESPYADEREHHAQQAIDDGVQTEWFEAFGVQMHD